MKGPLRAFCVLSFLFSSVAPMFGRTRPLPLRSTGSFLHSPTFPLGTSYATPTTGLCGELASMLGGLEARTQERGSFGQKA